VTHRAIAWDIDGTLIDSEPLHHQSLLAGCRNWGIDLGDLPDQAFRGIHMGDVWTMLRPRLPAGLDCAPPQSSDR
jgi:beta-phosphoglucomutase-like phosphatase (HAD superfamily)